MSEYTQKYQKEGNNRYFRFFKKNRKTENQTKIDSLKISRKLISHLLD